MEIQRRRATSEIATREVKELRRTWGRQSSGTPLPQKMEKQRRSIDSDRASFAERESKRTWGRQSSGTPFLPRTKKNQRRGLSSNLEDATTKARELRRT